MPSPAPAPIAPPTAASSSAPRTGPLVALLTAGRDKPYALGLGPALADAGLAVDFIGSNDVNGPEIAARPRIRFLNLRRDQSVDAVFAAKTVRVFAYYARLVAYAFRSHAPVFHLLWNNKFEHLDRTFLMLLYRLLGKRVVLTVHNVNAGERDGNDSWLNRLTLRIQYRLCHHLFVHTRRMRDELVRGYRVLADRVSVIPFGINNTLPSTNLSSAEARVRLGLGAEDRVLLFFGNIAPYKGLDGLVEAFAGLASRDPALRLVIAGRPKGAESHWAAIERRITRAGLDDRVRRFIEYIPDERVEVFFKAADVFVLPYLHVFQSGVLFLGYSFGLPVVATDVGALREEILEGQTGFVCRPQDSADLAAKLATFFSSPLHHNREHSTTEIRAYANRQYSWTTVAEATRAVYERLLR